MGFKCRDVGGNPAEVSVSSKPKPKPKPKITLFSKVGGFFGRRRKSGRRRRRGGWFRRRKSRRAEEMLGEDGVPKNLRSSLKTGSIPPKGTGRGRRLLETNIFVNGKAYIIKKTVSLIGNKIWDFLRKNVPRTHTVLKEQGALDKLIKNVYGDDGFMNFKTFYFKYLANIGRLALAQIVLDLTRCGGQGGGRLSIYRGRQICKAFASIGQIDKPIVMSPQPRKDGKGLWGDAKVHNFARTKSGMPVYRVLWDHYDKNGEPVPGKSKPIGTRFIVQKCATVTEESWQGIQNPENGTCAAFIKEATNVEGKMAQQKNGKFICFEGCDPGVKPECTAQIDWKYSMCSTCCCKGGVGYKSSVDVALTHKTNKAGCGKWFQIVDLVTNAILNLITRGDAIMKWSSRCIKF